jgi:glycosyltransferase involved in cell wall biosynthesis
MKVVQLVGRSTGGIGTHVGQLVAELRHLGLEVVVVTHPLTAERFGWGDARTWWPRDPWHPLAAVRNLRRLRAVVAGADVVHAHGHQAGLLATLLAVAAPRPGVMVSQHNLVLAGSGLRRVKVAAQRLVARRADLVTGASTDLVEQARALGAADARLARVPSPKVPALLARPVLDDAERADLAGRLLGPAARGLLGPAERDPHGPAAGNPHGPAAGTVPGSTAGRTQLVLTVSRIAAQKDLEALVTAAAAVQAPCRFVVVGDGDADLRTRLEDQIRSTGAPVELVGARDDVAQLLRAADVFVLPSAWEARALVVQEAMAAGTPVVASDVGGLRDLVDGSGRLVAAGDADGLARAVDTLLADPAQRTQASRAGREAAAALPDGPSAAREWVRWYDEVTRSRRSAARSAAPMT